MSAQPLFRESSSGISILGKCRETPLKMKKAGRQLAPWWVHKDRDPKMRREASRMTSRHARQESSKLQLDKSRALPFVVLFKPRMVLSRCSLNTISVETSLPRVTFISETQRTGLATVITGHPRSSSESIHLFEGGGGGFPRTTCEKN